MHRILPFAAPLFITPLFFSIVPPPIRAQEIGLHVNIARTSLSDSDDVTGAATRLGGGISFDIPFSDNAGFQTGMFLARKGVRFSGELPVSGGIHIDYAELPALLRVGIPVEGSARPYLLLGPALAIKLSCSGYIDTGATTLSEDCDDVDLGLRALGSFDLGLTGGFGVAITPSRGVSIRLDARYNMGLRNIGDDGVPNKNRALTGQAGIAFPVG